MNAITLQSESTDIVKYFYNLLIAFNFKLWNREQNEHRAILYFKLNICFIAV